MVDNSTLQWYIIPMANNNQRNQRYYNPDAEDGVDDEHTLSRTQVRKVCRALTDEAVAAQGSGDLEGLSDRLSDVNFYLAALGRRTAVFMG